MHSGQLLHVCAKLLMSHFDLELATLEQGHGCDRLANKPPATAAHVRHSIGFPVARNTALLRAASPTSHKLVAIAYRPVEPCERVGASAAAWTSGRIGGGGLGGLFERHATLQCRDPDTRSEACA
jgi:hypothetical protein